MITEILLRDHTTGRNIIWANGSDAKQEIQPAQIELIKPRWQKVRAHQKQRTRDRAEIFTPPEVCKIQNDLFDNLKRSWADYVDAKFLEITCGEAPYLVSRYNAVTGEPIPLNKRVGLLDRKLRVISTETKILRDWTEYALRAVKSVYGYEFQGDNLFLARRNVFETVVEYFVAKFPRRSDKPPENFWTDIAEIISWNLWQMDGSTCSPPFMESANLFGGMYCRIMNWATDKPFEFVELVGEVRR